MIQNGNFDYDDSNKNDPDLAAHFTVAKKRGVSLFGPTTEQRGKAKCEWLSGLA